jgi:formylglycine-generating enzyme required for sulfatase activity/uncharacterized caspase-like protein
MGSNWAIAIGINKYNSLQQLNFAKLDAEAMRDWFEKEAQFEKVFLFTEDSAPISTSGASIPTLPTYGNVRRFLRANFEKPLLAPGDNLWFFFAGHGCREGDRDYLMLLDSDPGDVEHTAISVDYVTQRLRRSGADNVVLFLDACRNEGRGGGLGGIGEQKYQGVVTFYSCMPQQKSYEIEQLQHGVFTKVLLEGLRIGGEGNCATVERLDQYLRVRVPAINQQYRKERQNPYVAAEPATKLHLILLTEYATLHDIATLKNDAYRAEVQQDWELARQLWIRVNIAARGSDLEAINAFSRLGLRQEQVSVVPKKMKTVVSNDQSETAAREARRKNTETVAQRKVQGINRRQLLQWAGLGGAGLLAVVGYEVLKDLSLTPKSSEGGSQELEATPKQMPTPKLTEGGSQELGIPLSSMEFETVKVDKTGKIVNQYSRQAKSFKEDLGNGITLEMVLIPAGSFVMGSPLGEKGRKETEGPQHKVNVPTFLMGKFAVTQEQYKQVMGNNPSYFKGDKRPVERVSWNSAIEFCQKLSGRKGRKYRLPSEAEWEYACRAGTTTPFYCGETITTDLANYDGTRTYGSEPKGKRRGQTTDVGSFPANSFGLYDMHGNVLEWCADHWHDDYNGAPTDGSAWLSNNVDQYRLLRGGSWSSSPEHCRSAARGRVNPEDDIDPIGIRVVCGVAPGTL